jgi:hypothetical protein
MCINLFGQLRDQGLQPGLIAIADIMLVWLIPSPANFEGERFVRSRSDVAAM